MRTVKCWCSAEAGPAPGWRASLWLTVCHQPENGMGCTHNVAWCCQPHLPRPRRSCWLPAAMVMQTWCDGQPTCIQHFLQDADSSCLARKGQTSLRSQLAFYKLWVRRVVLVSYKGTRSLQVLLCHLSLLRLLEWAQVYLTNFQHVLPLPLLATVCSQEGES